MLGSVEDLLGAARNVAVIVWTGSARIQPRDVSSYPLSTNPVRCGLLKFVCKCYLTIGGKIHKGFVAVLRLHLRSLRQQVV